MNRWLLRAKTAWKLGAVSLTRYLIYQATVRTGLNQARKIPSNWPSGPFFQEVSADSTTPAIVMPSRWQETGQWFGWHEVPLHGSPPPWHTNPFNGHKVANPSRPWWEIPDFDPELGDIKTVWEASRFEWVPLQALRAARGEEEALERLNGWLADWLDHNQPGRGANWKCGQEASLRVLHLAIAALIARQATTPLPALCELVRLHLQRIAPTIRYALAQNNNHGTSEAAALFVGGTWLQQVTGDKQGQKWGRIGRKWLQERAASLIAADGSFSQHSVNYHRLMLDTLSVAEVWRQHLGQPPFSEQFYSRCQAATHWLHTFADPDTGAAPNIGANDGAWLLPLETTDYTDYRPTVQLAAALFLKRRAFPPGPWNGRLHWLRVPVPAAALPEAQSHLFDDGGYAVLLTPHSRLFVRYPRYRFRPGHADGLHVDFWLDGHNILRDGGSWSYAAEPEWQSCFRGCTGHNTICFDDHDQMPLLSRFLYGEWLTTKQCDFCPTKEGGTFSAAYRDWQGCHHHREVALSANSLRVSDRLSGFREKAVLRWRLLPGAWRREGDVWVLGALRVGISADVPIIRQELTEGQESRYYLKKEPVPVLEAVIDQPGRFETAIHWSHPTFAQEGCPPQEQRLPGR